jgi:sporulation protein YlmC with PRC-barrel domain
VAGSLVNAVEAFSVQASTSSSSCLCTDASAVAGAMASILIPRTHQQALQYQRKIMKSNLVAWLVASSLALASIETHAQVAGAQPLGISVEVSQAIVAGWSVRKSIMDKPVFNEKGERVGVIHDIIVAPDRSVSFAIIAANQFLGVSHHDVAIPIEQLDFADGKLVLTGATKAAIKALPAFQYAKVSATPKARADFEDHH